MIFFVCFSLHTVVYDLVSVTLIMHAFIKEDATDFKIDRVPAHSNWIHQFSLQAVQTRNSSSDAMYFAYPGDETNCPKSVTRDLSLADLNCLPRDFFFASGKNQTDLRKVLLVNRGDKLSYGITLDEYHDCCGQMVEDYFFANLSLPSMCTLWAPATLTIITMPVEIIPTRRFVGRTLSP